MLTGPSYSPNTKKRHFENSVFLSISIIQRAHFIKFTHYRNYKMKRGFVYDRHSDLDLILKKEKSKALKSLKTASLRQARLINSIFEAPYILIEK